MGINKLEEDRLALGFCTPDSIHFTTPYFYFYNLCVKNINTGNVIVPF